MNPHPSIFPLLIKKYNADAPGSREFYDYLRRWGVTRGQAKEIKALIQQWIEAGNGDEYFKEY